VLTFTPTAWSKLRFLRDLGPTEIGGFGVSHPDDLLRVEDIVLVKQSCSIVTVAFYDDAVADYFDRMVDQGLQPEQFARIWLHSHPGSCPQPSAVDEATFTRVFGRNDWSIMGIVARNDATYARLRYRVGPGGSWEIPVRVDFSSPFSGSDHDAWREEYSACVVTEKQGFPLLASELTRFDSPPLWEEGDTLWP
jgi:proteasome lid subunit RPN8/RPN11